jgi:hypothetical protein
MPLPFSFRGNLETYERCAVRGVWRVCTLALDWRKTARAAEWREDC